jgi:hypothetical protein
MDHTFITLHRKMLLSACFADAELLQLWIWCLLRANFKDREIVHDGRLVNLKRGEFITGRFTATKELNMSVKKFRNRIELLEKMGQISLKRANKYTIITVVKYDDYQTKEEKRANRRPTEGQQKATDNKVNKVNKENKVNSDKSPAVSSKPKKAKIIPEVTQVYLLFEEELGKLPKNWYMNTTQRQAAENLYTERGLETIGNALRWYNEHKSVAFCPQITSPYDLDSKWSKLNAFKKKLV